jgi:hypothetical protein
MRAAAPIIAAVAAFYCWTATSSGTGFQWGERQTDYYNLQAEAFQAGQIALLVTPKPELLALPNPYDAKANAAYRLYDASLYKGKYYLYFGPVPVLTLFLPWKAITGSGIPAGFSIVVFLTAGYIFSCLLLFQLLRASGVRAPMLLRCVAVVCLGLCQAAPILLRRPEIYEVAIAAALCFSMGGLYFLTRRILQDDEGPATAVLSGLFLGLAAGCRPHFSVVAIVVAAVYLGHRRKVLLREAGFFGGPIVMCGLLLAWYNYVRFDSPFEFGIQHQLTFTTIEPGIPADFRNLLSALYSYLCAAPRWTQDFPYLKLATRAPFWLPPKYYVERAAGLVGLTPLYLGCLLPIFWRSARDWFSARVRLAVILVYASGATALVVLCLLGWFVMRYVVDFAPALLVVSLFLWLWVAARAPLPWMRSGARAMLLAGCAWGVFVNAALSINGYANGLVERNPEAYYSLASFFGQKDEAIARPVRELTTQAFVTFTRKPAGAREALLTTGSPEEADFVFVEHQGSQRLRFAYSQWRGKIVYGPELTIVPRREYSLSIRYDGDAGALAVYLGDALVLEHATRLHPTSRVEVSAGDDPLRGPRNIKRWSGSLRVVAGVSRLVSYPSNTPRQ